VKSQAAAAKGDEGKIMFEIHVEELEWGGRTLRFETGRMARQADGAVLVTYGETTVLATVVAEHSPKPGLDFFPLTVNYQEKTYAAGKIPGGYFKREGRPTEKETLVSRLIDRPIRPLFVQGFKCETQVITTVLSHDMENDPDIVAMVAASAALTLSGIPFLGPIAAARVGLINGDFILNPTFAQVKESDLDLVVAGTADAVMMVESEAHELSEQMMLDAVMFGHREFQPVIDAIIDLAEKAAKAPRDVPESDISELTARVRELAEPGLRAAYETVQKEQRRERVAETRDHVVAELIPADATEAPDPLQVKAAFKAVEKDIVRSNIIETEKRIDGRSLSDVRQIICEVGVLPRTHGSALFTRGETQALCVTTLGTGEDEQYVDSLEGTYKQNFLLHYNFPPFSVGEWGASASPAGARSVTASSPGGPSVPCCRRTTSSRTRSGWSRRSPNPTARPRWPRCAARRCR
jgi:polyribonucleotide nucleotidyltransferase